MGRQMKGTRAESMRHRRAVIKTAGLRDAAQVAAQFGVSAVTARSDLRAVYGALPKLNRRRKARAARLAAIEELGLTDYRQIAAKFNISRVTACRDVQTLYGEWPRLLPVIGAPTRHFNFYVPKSEYAQMQELAAERQCSVSDIARAAIREYLAANLPQAQMNGKGRP